MDRKPESLAVDALLNRGVRFEMPLPPFLRWAKKSIAITLRHTYYGISLRISKLYVRCGIDLSLHDSLKIDDVLNLYARHGKAMSRIVALAVLNNVFLLWLVRPVAWLLRNFTTDAKMGTLLAIIIGFSASRDFVNIIYSAAAMTVTTPPEQSQKTKGS